jgi:sec-independent protein translocase protein TatB
MDFLGVGPLELLFIIVIALIVLGPRDLAKHARTVGRFLNRLYKSETWKAMSDASRSLRTLPNRLAREAALEELQEVREDLEETRKIFSEAPPEIEDASPEQGLPTEPIETGDISDSSASTTPPSPAE